MIAETPGQSPTLYDPELDPGFDVIEPDALTCPLVFSSPHSGAIYPQRFLERTRLSQLQLRRSEDAFVDALFEGGRGLGAPMIRALFPRTYLDLNREPYELDPRMFDGRLPAFANTRSIRVAGGLGTIPRVVGQAQEIYAARLPVDEALARIDRLYKPYHARLRGLVDRAQHNFGLAVLVDCHSMPSGGPAAGETRARADFVLGDRHGASCAAVLIEAAEAELRALGFKVARNKPYAGGFITEHHGNPAINRHAIQIEVSRSLYMDEQTVERSGRFVEIRAALTRVAMALAATAATVARLSLHRDAAE